MFGLIKLTFALAAPPVRVAMIPVRVAGRQVLRIPAVRRAADRVSRVLPKRLRGGGKKGKGKKAGKKSKPDERREAYLAARTPRPGETPGSKSSGGQGGDAARMQAQMVKMQKQQQAFQQQMFKQQMEWMQRNTVSVADLAKMLTRHLASKDGSALDVSTLVQSLTQRGVAPAVAQAALQAAHGKGWIKKAGSGRVAASAKSVRAHGVPTDDLAQRRNRRAAG